MCRWFSLICRDRSIARYAAVLLLIALTASSAGAQPGRSGIELSRVNANEGSPNRPIADKWALVIGVGKFADSTVPKLQYASKDAKDFADFLVKKAHFAPDHVRVLLDKDATQRRVLTELGDKFLPRVVKPGDLVVIYFSGHGSPSDVDVKSKNYVVAYDTEKSNLFASGIDVQDLTKLIKSRVDTDRVLLILDACHSGAAEAKAKGIGELGSFDPSVAIGSGQMVICSSTKDERSWESKRYPNGVFTHHLMESMDRNGANARVSKIFKDMQEGVHDEVQQDEGQRQTPLIKSQWTGDDPAIAALPSSPRPMPESVRKLLEQSSASNAVVETQVVEQPAPQTVAAVPPQRPVPPPQAKVDAPNEPTQKEGEIADDGGNTPLASSNNQPPAGLFTPPDKTFGVAMPGSVQSQETNTANGLVRQYVSQSGAAGYYITACRFPAINQKHGRELLMDWGNGLIAGLVASGMRWQGVREFYINGHPAYEYKLWSYFKQGRMVLCGTDRETFSFTAYVGNPGNLDETQSFFDSIYIK